ncbi:MAG TPA: TolC family protein, partial [Cytophagaceae bacterium]|nr:TolC family protein [Cytophagaceae bacterium]
SLTDAQQAFTDKNLQLVIQKFGIEQSKAQITQARLFSNPNINYEQTLTSQRVVANNEELGPYAEHALQIQKLFLMAGKRNKNIHLAQINAQISEYQFFDLLRTLTYSLNSNFFELAFQFKTVDVYKQEIETIERLVIAYRELQKDGNAALKDVVRLESVLFSLESDLSQLELAIAENQADLRILLGVGTNVFVVPVINEDNINALRIDNQTLNGLIDIAEENRYDIKVQKANIQYAHMNLKLQKAYAIPDLTFGYTFDKAGNYINNYNALTLQTNLPLFNRNQGNIKIADYQLRSNEKSLEYAHITLNNDVILAYTQAIKIENLYQNFDKQFVENFNTLIKGVITGYEKKTISLVEFMDFFDSYKQNVVQFNTLRNNRVQSYLKLNFSVAKSVFTF